MSSNTAWVCSVPIGAELSLAQAVRMNASVVDAWRDGRIKLLKDGQAVAPSESMIGLDIIRVR